MILWQFCAIWHCGRYNLDWVFMCRVYGDAVWKGKWVINQVSYKPRDRGERGIVSGDCHDPTVTVLPSYWPGLHQTGFSLSGCEWTRNNSTSTAVKPTTTPQQSGQCLPDIILLILFLSPNIMFSPDNCWGDHKAPWPCLGPPATKFSRLMDANIDGSGLARNQLFQNQNIHYQQTTGWGVGCWGPFSSENKSLASENHLHALYTRTHRHSSRDSC